MGYQRPLGAQSEGSKAPSGLKVKKKVGAKMAGAKMAWSENGWSDNGGAKRAREIMVERFQLPANNCLSSCA